MHEGIGRRLVFKSLDLGPEVVRVRLNSVVAMVYLTDDYRQHFALLP